MHKWSSPVARVLLPVIVFLLATAVLFFALSNAFFNDLFSGVSFRSMREALQGAVQLFNRYQTGEATLEEVHAAVNPALSTDDGFFILLNQSQQLIASTDGADAYFDDDLLPSLLEELQQERSAYVQKKEGRTRVLLIGQRTEGGYVIIGRPTTAFRGEAEHFRLRLFFSTAIVVLMGLAFSYWVAHRASKPARIITQMAMRLTQGEQMTVPENLPGQEMQEIARALNDLSRKVAQAIRELKNEKENMSLILEGLNEGILAVDETGRILHENQAALQMLGGEGAPVYAAVMAALGEEHEGESWVSRVTSGDRILHIAVSRLSVEEGRRQGAVALIRDVTEQERLERTRHDYVANISHELRTPLSSIRGLGEGLRDGMVTEEKDKQRYYSIIAQEANRLSRLVNDLLELSSLQSNPAAFEQERVDPNELILDLHDRNRFLFQEKGVAFEPALPASPLPAIFSNEDRLAQVLTILLDNARKYTPEGGRVILGAEKRADGIRFFVRDNGIGMDEETKALAFDRFHQAERSRSDKGSGLGLAIAREVLQKMEVEIGVSSELGKGSEFFFTVSL